MPKSIRHRLCALAGILLMIATPLAAEQFTLIDGTWEVTGGFSDSGQQMEVPRKMMRDNVPPLVGPIDYYENGYLHITMEFSELGPADPPVTLGSIRVFTKDGSAPPALYNRAPVTITGDGVVRFKPVRIRENARPALGPVPKSAFATGISHLSFKDYSKEAKRVVGSLQKLAPFRIRLVVIISTGPTYEPPGTYGGLGFAEIVHLADARAHWQSGLLGQALAIADRQLASKTARTPQVVTEAQRIVEAATRYRDGILAEIQASRGGDPVSPVERLSMLAQTFAGSTMGRELADRVRAESETDAYRSESAARKVWATVEPAVSRLKHDLGGATIATARLSPRNTAAVRQFMDVLAFLRKNHPDTACRARVESIATELGVPTGP